MSYTHCVPLSQQMVMLLQALLLSGVPTRRAESRSVILQFLSQITEERMMWFAMQVFNSWPH